MVLRRGVGATAVAAVVFSVILVSNVALYSAAQDRQRLYGVAETEDSVGVAAFVLSSAAVTDALVAVQGWLGAGPLKCATAAQSISTEVAGVRESESSSSVLVSATASMWAGGGLADNLSSVSPFQGAEAGALNLVITTAARGSAPDGVSYSRIETHLVHLPARPAQEAAECLEGAAAAARYIGGTSVDNCTAGVVAPLMDRLRSALTSAATEGGFALGFAYSFRGARSCIVMYRITITQRGVEGPAGPFSVEMGTDGSATFAPPAQPPPK